MTKRMLFSNERYNELVEMIFKAETINDMMEVVEIVDFEMVGVFQDVTDLVSLWGKKYKQMWDINHQEDLVS